MGQLTNIADNYLWFLNLLASKKNTYLVRWYDLKINEYFLTQVRIKKFTLRKNSP